MPYPPTLSGLGSARQVVRMMLNRIVTEVDLIARSPDLAVDESSQASYMSPLLFREMLPVGSHVPVSVAEAAPTKTETVDPETSEAAVVADIASKMGGKIRF